MQKQRYTVKELIEDPSFKRWVEGAPFEKEEAGYWDRWVQESEHNRRVALKAQQILTGISFKFSPSPGDDNEIADEWAHLVKELTAENNAIFNLPDRQSKEFSAKKKSKGNLLKVAAIIVFMFAAAWYVATKSPFATSQKKVVIRTITTKTKEKKTISLSDGSKVTLAAGSKLSYAEDWLSKPIKRLKLKGEAYFSIVPLKVKDHPKFVVQTKDGTAAVWGTQFSVSTYGNHTQIVLQRGDVRLHVSGESNQKTTMMKPGQLADFKHNSRKVTLRRVNPRVYTSWASDRLVFDHTPLSVLVKRIRRTYGVKVKVAREKLLVKKLSGSVDFGELDPLIHAVQKVLGVHITLRGNTVYIGNPSQLH